MPRLRKGIIDVDVAALASAAVGEERMTSWKTTVAGIVTLLCGVAMVFVGYLKGTTELALVGVGMLPIAYGLWNAKDYNVTGGTVGSTPEAAKRVNGGSNG